MLMQNYQDQALLSNVSVLGSTSSGQPVFRGDLVIEPGEIADSQGRRGPPKAIVKQAVALFTAEKFKMLVGALNQVSLLELFFDQHGHAVDSDSQLLFYVADLKTSLTVNWGESTAILIPYDDGAVWNMLMDDLRLEKSDFKGQSAEDKVATMYENLLTFKPNYPAVTYQEALTSYCLEIKREARGPV